MKFTRFAMAQGWGDGLPAIPPTEARVREFLGANNRHPDEVICRLPPTSMSPPGWPKSSRFTW